jgi:hypothetical protein
MRKTMFPIMTDAGVRTVEGFKTDDTSLIGIHREGKSGPWTVTFLPAGTKIDTVFPERFYARPALLARIAEIENKEAAAFGALADIPWGAVTYDDIYAPAIERIRAAVKP